MSIVANILKLKPETPAEEIDHDSVLWLLHDRLRLIQEREAELSRLKLDRLPEIERLEREAEARELEAERHHTELAIRKERGELDPDPKSEARARLRKAIEGRV